MTSLRSPTSFESNGSPPEIARWKHSGSPFFLNERSSAADF